MSDSGQLDRLKRAALTIQRLEQRLTPLEQAEKQRTEPIAIVGIGCRFPGGASSPEAFWELLDAGRDAIQPLEPRWQLLGAHAGDEVPRWAGLLTEAIDEFDAPFFGISPREARSLDPQHRLLLEVSWEALENAGILPRSLDKSRTGVFVGACSADYRDTITRQPHDQQDAYSGTGNALSIAAGRIAYTLGLQGPCLVIDTACSSSLVAIHLACRSLHARESELALAGGVNMVLSPEVMEALARTQALSPDGRCKTFDAAANGIVRGEGCGLLVLKRLADAQRDGDRIWALIRGSAVNQDGRSTGLTTPNVLAQEALLREALKSAGIEPGALDYVETHGTGTSLGDPIEVEALRGVLGALRSDHRRCVLGAVKTNLGHLEAAAGVAGIVKASLALSQERIPKNLNFRTLNAHIDLAGTSLALATEPVPWPRGQQPRFAGVSGFGLSGTNAHVVLQEAPQPQPAAAVPAREAELFVLSAQTEAAVHAQAARLGAHLQNHQELPLYELAQSLVKTRSALDHRLAIVARSREALQESLVRAAQGQDAPKIKRGRVAVGPVPKVVFVFPGQGSQWLGMGQTLLVQEPVFREALTACDRAIFAEAGFSILAELAADEAESQLNRIDVVQPLLFAMGVALAALWQSWGVKPDAVVGHSLGEVAAAHVSGALTLSDAVAIICHRSRLLRRISGQGEMAMVELALPEAEQALSGYESRLSVAVSNSPLSTVLAGEPTALAEVIGKLEQKGIFCQRIKTDVASHSPQVDPLRHELAAALARLAPSEAVVPMRSTVTGATLKGPELGADYWAENLRQPVRFAESVQGLLDSGHGLFIEMSPHPILVPAVAEILGAGKIGGIAVGSLRYGQPEREALLSTLGALWTQGYPVALERQFPVEGRRVPLPTYPWQRQRHWVHGRESLSRTGAATGHPLLGVRVPAADSGAVFEAVCGTGNHLWLGDHRVAGKVLLPGAAVAELCLAAAAHAAGSAAQVADLVLQAPLVLAESESQRVQVVLTQTEDSGRTVAVYSQPASSAAGAAWTKHATARVELGEAVAPPALDLPALRERCSEGLDVGALYARLAALGVAYGPAFQGLRSLSRGSGEALAEVRLGAGSDSASYGIHPALLDSAFHALAGVVEFESEGQLMLPFTMDRFVVYQEGAESAWVHVQLQRDPEDSRVTAKVALADESGAVVAQVTGLKLQPMAPQSVTLQKEAAEAPTDAFYRMEWQPSPLPETSVGQLEGNWVIVAPRGSAAAAALARRLRGSVAVEPRGLGMALKGSESAATVVCLWEADVQESPAAVAQRVALQGLEVWQALQERTPKRLWWVTTRAVRSEPVDIATSTIWGLGRTVMSEQPELGCTLVDVESEADAIDCVVRELSANAEENQIAWRAGSRHVARLVRCTQDGQRAAAQAPLCKEGTALVTGGLGALGLHVARWLAKQGAAHLLLTGRRGLDTPGAAAALAELQALGARVTVAAVDVADREALKLTLEAIPKDLPLRWVVHAAGVLDDGVLREQTPERFKQVLLPKVQGAWNLHELTAGQPLDSFVLFSSLAGLLGPAGQGNYAAANAFLDALAAHRRASGLPAHSLGWGAWAEVGLAAALDATQQARLSQQGIKWLSPAEGIALFERALARSEAHLAVTRLDLRMLSQALGADVPPVWRSLVRVPAVRWAGAAKGAWAARVALLPPARREEEVRSAVQAEVARVLLLATPDAVHVDRPFQELGLDSLMAVELRNALGQRLGKTLSATLAFDHPTVSALARWLLTEVIVPPGPGVAPDHTKPRPATDEPIAIVGIGCRYPGGVRDLDSFWQLLHQGIDAVGEIPKDRWDIEALYDPDPDALGKMVTRCGGFLSDIDQFDAGFFGISPREAEKMDPQQRLLLETSWEALAQAGIRPEGLLGSDTGVYVGLMYQEYAALSGGLDALDGYVATGSAASVASGRISYLLGLKGPSLTVDSACSSSLVTLHLACQALRQGECSMALAGGVTVMLTPAVFVEFSRLRGLAPDGRCKSFSAAANGAGWSEGCGMLVLKRLSDAVREGAPILAVIRGSAVNQDGRSNGLTAPNGPSQQALIQRALAQAGVAPGEVAYVECHGTGTTLGDPIEAQALGAALADGRPQERPVQIGSVKSNLGHTQAAAGVAGVIKVVLALQHGAMPKSLHAETLNPHIPWSELPLKVTTEEVQWPRTGVQRIAGVSSFGISGTNAHMVLAEAPLLKLAHPAPERAAELVVLSARSEPAVNAQAARLQEHLTAHPELSLAEVAYSLATARSGMEHRMAIATTSRAALQVQFARATQGQTPLGTVRGTTASPRGKVAFLFTGQGAQVPGMGQGLYAAWPVFRESFERCSALFDRELDRPLREVMWADAGSADAALLGQTAFTQPALFALEYAMYALWSSWGVTPDFVSGHSLGELVAAAIAGVFSLEDAVRLCAARGRLMQELPAGGAMISIAASEAEVAEAVAPQATRVSIAALNGPEQVVIAGEQAAVTAIAAEFARRGVRTKALAVSHAFHSPLMEPMLEAFRRVAETVRYQEPSLALVSNESGKLGTHQAGTAAYWVRHVREAVRFADGIQTLHREGVSTFVELGPQATLLGLVPACLPEAKVRLISSVRRGSAEAESALEALGGVWSMGLPIDWSGVFPAGSRRVPLPNYPWQRQRHWVQTPAGQTGPTAKSDRPRVAEPDIHSWFYETKWTELPSQGSQPSKNVRRWIVLSDKGEIGAALGNALREQGDFCAVITADAPSALDQQLAAMGDDPWGIIHLLSLDAPLNAKLTVQDADRERERVCGALLRLLPRLMDFKQPPQIWLVTRGAQSVGKEDVCVAQAPLWGLGRVLSLEHPKLWGGLVDLDPAKPADQTACLCQTIRSQVGEDHIAWRNGKRYVARLVHCSPSISNAGHFPVHADKTYWITGGLGGLGLSAAAWLVQRGARHLVLTGRSALPERTRWDESWEEPTRMRMDAVRKLEAQGANVIIESLNVADMKDMQRLVQSLDMPLGGVIHAAGVGSYTPLLSVDTEQVLASDFEAKVLGTWALHMVTRDLALDFFVMFSSGAATWGGKGQGHYGAANHFLDAVAHARRSMGLPALSLNLGLVAGGGMSGGATEQFAAIGLKMMPTPRFTEALELAMRADGAQYVVAWIDWSRFKPIYEIHRAMPLLAAIDLDDDSHHKVASQDQPAQGRLRELIRTAAPEERTALLLNQIKEDLAQVMHMHASQIQHDTLFMSLGVDSMMSMEMRNRLSLSLGLQLPATVLFTQRDTASLASHLLALLDTGDASAPRARPEPPPPVLREARVDAIRTNAQHRSQDGWIVIPRPIHNAKMRLIAFPYAGGAATVFQQWPGLLCSDIEVCAVQLPGRQERLSQPIPSTIDELVDALLPALLPYLDRPFALFGHCMGAILAYEVLCRLREYHAPLPVHLFVSGAQPPSLYFVPNPTLQAEDRFVEVLGLIGFAAAEILADKEEISTLLAPVLGDMSIASHYSPKPAEPFNISITSFAGKDDIFASPDHVDWSKETVQRYSRHTYPGQHYFINPERAPILRVIQEDMLRHLAVIEHKRELSESAQSLRSRWLHKPCAQPNAQRRLICFPCAGGDASIFSSWPMALSEDVEVVAIELPGHGQRASETPFCRVEDIVDALVPLLSDCFDKPFAFVGHDLGALLMFEVSRSLCRNGLPLPTHLFVSAAMAPQTYYFPPLHLASTEAMNRTLRVLTLLPEGSDMIERAWRGDIAAMSNYIYQHNSPLVIKITTVLGDHDVAISLESNRRWQHQTTAAYKLHIVPGDHHNFRNGALGLLAVLRGDCTVPTAAEEGAGSSRPEGRAET